MFFTKSHDEPVPPEKSGRPPKKERLRHDAAEEAYCSAAWGSEGWAWATCGSAPPEEWPKG